MERDMDLIRKILIELEKKDYEGIWHELKIDNYSLEKINYHVMLLAEANLIKAQNLSDHDGIDWKPKRLTWQGHEFLEAAKDEKIWEQAKEILKQKGGNITFSVLKALLTQLVKSKFLGG